MRKSLGVGSLRRQMDTGNIHNILLATCDLLGFAIPSHFPIWEINNKRALVVTEPQLETDRVAADVAASSNLPRPITSKLTYND